MFNQTKSWVRKKYAGSTLKPALFLLIVFYIIEQKCTPEQKKWQ